MKQASWSIVYRRVVENPSGDEELGPFVTQHESVTHVVAGTAAAAIERVSERLRNKDQRDVAERDSGVYAPPMIVSVKFDHWVDEDEVFLDDSFMVQPVPMMRSRGLRRSV